MFKKAVLSNKFSSIQLLKVAAGYKQVQPRIEGSKENETFTKEFTDRRIKLSAGQKFFLGTGSSIAALVDPRRHDMIAALGETTSIGALAKQHELMKSTPEGLLILTQKPRINTKTINLDELRNLSETTLGFSYQKFLAKNNVTPDSRLDVRFMDDPQLAYLMTRYRECHDLIHTILGMPTNMLGEVTVKWVEALNIGLPMCYGAAIFGAMRLHPKQRKLYKTHYLPWAIENGKNMKLLMSVYWEHRWEQDVSDLRHELNIRPFPCDT